MSYESEAISRAFYEALTPAGLAERTRADWDELVLRWTYRYEMWHLLTLAGFDRIVEYSDFCGSPPAYGGEQVWVCRRPA